MEDVLAELVHRNYATLNLHNGDIIAIPDSEKRRYVYNDRGVLDVWQDHPTGAIVPANWVDPYSSDSSEALSLPPLEKAQFQSFLEAPNGHLINMLVRADPTIGFGEDSEWRLDRLIDRSRLNAQPLSIPIQVLEIQAVQHHYVRVPELPAWITRIWTKSLQNIVTSKGEPLQLALEEQEEESTISALNHCRLDFYVGRWAQSAQEVLDKVPPPRSVHEVRTLVQRHTELQERLLSLVSTSLSAPSGRVQSHFDLALKRSEYFVLIALARLTPSLTAKLYEVLRGQAPRVEVYVFQCVVDGNSRIPAQIEESLKGVATNVIPIAASPSLGIAGEFIVVDGSEMWLGSGEFLCSNHPVLHIRGWSVVTGLLGFVQSFIPPQSEGGAALRQRVRTASMLSNMSDDIASEAMFGGEGGRTVQEVLEDLKNFRRELSLAITEPALVEPERSEDDELRGPKIDNHGPDARIRAPGEPDARALRLVNPALANTVETLVPVLCKPLGQGYSASSFIRGMELSEVLSLALHERPSKRDTLRLSS
jgi:hypothetical protein